MITNETELREQLILLNTTIENAITHFENQVRDTDTLLGLNVGIGRDYIIPTEPFWVGIADAAINIDGTVIQAYESKSIPSDANML